MKFKYHGNYCGPGWSDGQYKTDAAGFCPPVDAFDACCQDHDRELAENPKTRYQADVHFAKCALSAGRVFEGAATVLYGSIDQSLARNNLKMSKKNLRAKPKTKKDNQKPMVYNGSGRSTNDTRRIAPVSVATIRTGSSAQMKMVDSGTIRVKHRSFIKPIQCGVGFGVEAIPVNPGMGGSFPWVAKVARKYDLYRFTSLKFVYRSVAATSEPGVIMMSFDYDAADAAPASKSRQAQTIPNVETNAWSSMELNVAGDGKWRFVRPGNLASNLDIKTYDLGNLFVSGVYGSGATVGELYVDYTVELKKPSEGTEDSGVMFNNITSFTSPFISTATYTGYPPFIYDTANRIEFITSGEYTLLCSTVGTGITVSPSLPTFLTGGSIAPLTNAWSTTIAIAAYKVRVEVGAILNFANCGAGTTVTAFNVRVAPIDYDSFN